MGDPAARLKARSKEYSWMRFQKSNIRNSLQNFTLARRRRRPVNFWRDLLTCLNACLSRRVPVAAGGNLRVHLAFSMAAISSGTT
jgi:hypothetical protein